MRFYSLLAAAKINLYLEIIGDRPDGFHELAMVMQSIDLADRVDLRLIGTDTILVHCDHPEVPADRRNLAYRAAELMANQFPDAFARLGGVEITVRKNIPVGAGLAGGSTNAAAVLVGLDLLWQLGLTQPELQDLGAQLGSDIPFCVSGGTALATGRGEFLDPLPDLDGAFVVLAKYRSLSISTAWAYQTYRQQFGTAYVSSHEGIRERRSQVRSGAMMAAIAQRHPAQIAQHLYNDLERVALPQYPQIQHLKEQFQSRGVLGTMMSGSGPTVFALVDSEAEAQRVRNEMRMALPDPDLELWVAKFTTTSIKINEPA
ncbi:4-(cytidine 5'-diphospho)-2-C-methyl-D-erythritol kinase [Leptolyngbya sp. 'hensonii']|uniref:4-(cytidine 5'-diphospho)-2-C-methyl-D-erythritol kinase n=1 Tax=Leptolyngbya sp. 'hensonii' TaxID=1922337 RepID=UPI00094F5E1A|nr:4-(cytidine 5'-diphospho)-2-C-methyl-D-erythritol kinase [Leptolyngbya sp. 'hensonii']OLP15501.1 4-(cytidine 5'-diphospho)-2-C-methyl-D-erythritol kinase [Leptolyngbya sp. 'hensonii']